MSTALIRNKAAKDFSRVPKINVPRSAFKMEYTRKMTLQEDYLVPIFCKEVIPGDTWQMDITHFGRMASQIVPAMDNLKIDTYFFFVPSRLVWEHFPNQMGERENPDDTIDYITPTIDMKSLTNGFEAKSIYDYMGLPINTPALTVSALPFRAINLIINQFFRDENLEESLTVKKDDSDDDPTLYKLWKKAKVSDYFTRALPDIQKGEPVMLPIGTQAQVYGDGYALMCNYGQTTTTTGSLAGATGTKDFIKTAPNFIKNQANVKSGTIKAASGIADNTAIGVATKEQANAYNSTTGLYTDLSEALGASISAVRQAIATEELLERDNRDGTRYTEMLEGRYGVSNPDLRLQRPEYLGGTRNWLTQVPVTQTSATDTTSPQANLAAYSITGDSGRVVNASFGEFGYVIGFMSIQGIPSYQQGIDRMWGRLRRFDYYYPEFAGLSDQAIYNKEIFAQGNNVKDENGNIIDDLPFGYQERYAEYRNWQNEIVADMRSTTTNNLDIYHFAEKFDQLPKLNADFIKSNTPVSRVLAVQNEEHFIMDIAFDATLYRPMPVYGIPQISSNLLLQ